MTPKQAAQAAVQASFNSPVGDEAFPEVLPPLDQQQVEPAGEHHPRRKRRVRVAAG